MHQKLTRRQLLTMHQPAIDAAAKHAQRRITDELAAGKNCSIIEQAQLAVRYAESRGIPRDDLKRITRTGAQLDKLVSKRPGDGRPISAGVVTRVADSLGIKFVYSE